MSENIISWTPCKIKKPPKKGFYFVTIKNPVTDVVVVRSFPHEDWMRRDFIAWAEMPKPYDKRRTKNVIVKWHSYPEERPNELVGDYLVTDYYKRKRGISIYGWYKSRNRFLEEGFASVIAWAEMPEPYKEQKNE